MRSPRLYRAVVRAGTARGRLTVLAETEEEARTLARERLLRDLGLRVDVLSVEEVS